MRKENYYNMLPTFSGVGKTTRINRIFKSDGRAVMVAINHGLGLGPVDGIEHMGKTLQTVMQEAPDSLTIHKGIALQYMDMFAGQTSLILKCTNATRYRSPEETAVATVEEALMLGADAIAVGLTLCGSEEAREIERAAEYIRAAEPYGLPIVTHSYPSGNLISDEERYRIENVGYAVRVSLELGVDIIKTFWTGNQESFAKIVELGSPAKVVISGGPKCETLMQCFEMTKQGIDAGAAGITYGRNIWQHPHPAAVIKGLNAIVHHNASAKDALEIASETAGCSLL